MSPGTASDAGSENLHGGPTAFQEPPKGTVTGSNGGRPAAHYVDTTAQRMIPMQYAPMPAPPSQHYPPARAGLQWSGEQSTRFGADITYTYYPFIEVNNLSAIPPQDVNYLDLQGCLRVPTKTILDEFVKQFFLHVHPIMPLLNEGDFWEMYASQSQGTHVSTRISLLMIHAMLFSVCGYVSRNSIKALGFPDVKVARTAFYRRAKFDFDAEAHAPLSFADLASEIERSRVYNSGTKKSLIEMLAHHIQLMVALTDLLVLVWPLDEAPQWARRYGEEEAAKIERCKGQLRSWYQRSTARFPMPGDGVRARPGAADGSGRGAEFHHDSVVLYTNLMYITYQ
ncbi:hypothetical protein SLS64_002326 [Diaporthe eres]